MKPEEVVAKQVVAYNNRDIDTFLACHAPEVELYNFSEITPYAVGRAALKEIYQDVFDNSPNLHAEITNRIVMDDTIIDHELVTGRKERAISEIVAIYEVKGGLIAKAHFIRKR